MKKLFILSVFVLFMFAVVPAAQAQLSKKEKKELKAKLKQFKSNPEKLKKILEENNSMKSQVSSLNNQVKSLQTRIGEKDTRISELTDANDALKNDIAAARKKLSDGGGGAQPIKRPMPTDPTNESGVVFKVQIGAFKQNDLSQYKGQKNFGVDSDGNINKYTIGVFRDYWEADKFKKSLRQMGVKDAWIVSYKDGVRVPIKDVLEGII